MRFAKSFSTAIVTLLLATTAVGELVQVVTDALEARAGNDLGPDPGKNPKRKEYFSKFCSKPQTPSKPKKGKRSTDVIVARAPPAGYDQVNPGQNLARKMTENGLYSPDFGTCVGFAVTGTPNPAGGNTRFLMHMTIEDWPSMNAQWRSFADKIDAAGLTNKAGVMYTVDTRASNTAELSDEYMREEANYLEQDYRVLWSRFREKVPSAARAYHPFSRVGTLKISKENRINYT